MNLEFLFAFWVKYQITDGNERLSSLNQCCSKRESIIVDLLTKNQKFDAEKNL